MPRYNYKCSDCKTEFELDLSLEEREDSLNQKKICLSCTSKNIEQILTFGGVLKHGKSKSADAPACSGGGCCPGKCF